MQLDRFKLGPPEPPEWRLQTFSGALPYRRPTQLRVHDSMRVSGAIASPPRSANIHIDKTQVVFVSTEVAPWSKTGGLADVIGSLPSRLADK